MALKSANRGEAIPDQEVLDGLDNGPGSAVARVDTNSAALGGFSGDTDDIQIRLPYLALAQGQGRLDVYKKGSWVVGGESLIAGPGEPVLLTILSVQAFWREYVSGSSYNPDVIPATYATKAEVLAAGGTTEWTGGTPPTFKQAGVLRVLISKPGNVEGGIFGVPIGGVAHAPALWTVDKTAAQEVLPVIKRDMAFSLRERGLTAGVYELRSKTVKFANGHSTYAPALKLVGYRTDAEVAEIASLFSGAAPASKAAEETAIPM